MHLHSVSFFSSPRISSDSPNACITHRVILAACSHVMEFCCMRHICSTAAIAHRLVEFCSVASHTFLTFSSCRVSTFQEQVPGGDVSPVRVRSTDVRGVRRAADPHPVDERRTATALRSPAVSLAPDASSSADFLLQSPEVS